MGNLEAKDQGRVGLHLEVCTEGNRNEKKNMIGERRCELPTSWSRWISGKRK